MITILTDVRTLVKFIVLKNMNFTTNHMMEARWHVYLDSKGQSLYVKMNQPGVTKTVHN